jgi:hypothetical protein
MARAAVSADLLQALDRLRALAAEVALDLEVPVDEVPELGDLLVREITDLLVGREPELGADAARCRGPDAVDVGQPDLEPLLTRKVDACDSCQILLPSLVVACAGGSCR